MSAAIDFYFELTSPYGYFAAEKIEELAARHGRQVDWHPLLLGVIAKTTGMTPPTQVPLKKDYVRRDWERISRLTGIPFNMPSVFPIASQNPARAILFVARSDEDIVEAMSDPAVKDQLKHEVGAAEARGVFGSPYVIVDGEPFWGFDRFDMLEEWLTRGGF
jgi:2-hydroxychromene-2-carboxylate isomerase